MSNTNENKSVEPKSPEGQQIEKPKKPVRKTQMQILQEALGLKPEDFQELEKKLFTLLEKDYLVNSDLFLGSYRDGYGPKHSSVERVSVDPINAECSLVSGQHRGDVHNRYHWQSVRG